MDMILSGTFNNDCDNTALILRGIDLDLVILSLILENVFDEPQMTSFELQPTLSHGLTIQIRWD